jgi:hypothetical protein
MWAARLGVPIESLEVEVQADYDVRGELGVSDSVRPGYLAIRYIVTVESPAPADDILRVLDAADRASSWRDDLANGVPITREIRRRRSAVEPLSGNGRGSGPATRGSGSAGEQPSGKPGTRCASHWLYD